MHRRLVISSPTRCLAANNSTYTPVLPGHCSLVKALWGRNGPRTKDKKTGACQTP
ncbi:hypothetical protein ACRALDRAFT_1062294 [Sodiomyces alcalophilus JCM 7366]|uniref:uncharacterized protein n=1 Tax=Sodiomyces alcalophilus JCM 7366 TaxID=591952 RepID=UPI0039B3C584